MWRPFDSPAKRRKRFIEKNSPYLVPLAVGAVAAAGDDGASLGKRVRRGVITGGQTAAAMKAAGIFANPKTRKNYYKNTILPTVQQGRGIINTGVGLSRELRTAKNNGFMNGIRKAKELRDSTKFDFWKKKKGIF